MWARIRKIVPPFLLVAGGVSAAAMVVPQLPHERAVDLRLDDAATVTGLELAWTPKGGENAGAVAGSTWHFATGTAPRTVTASVRLPNGRYDLDVTVERGTERTAVHRLITLGDVDRLSVPLR